MESLGEVLQQLDRFHRQQGGLTIEERLDRLKRHPLFRAWLQEQDVALDDSQLLKSMSDTVQYVRETEQCRQCPGLQQCPNTMQGFQPLLSVGDRQMIGLKLQKCDKLRLQEKQLAIQGLVRSHYVPSEIMQASFQTMDRDPGRVEAINALMEFCLASRESSLSGKGIYLYGPLGVGKSRMMGAVAKKLADQGIASLMIYVPEFLREMKESISDHSLNDKLEALKTIPVLILDDIGAETLSGWARDELLGTILQYRVSERKPVLYTSNLDLDGLEEHFAYSHKGGVELMKAKRVMERIRHYVDVYFVDGPNRRKR